MNRILLIFLGLILFIPACVKQQTTSLKTDLAAASESTPDPSGEPRLIPRDVEDPADIAITAAPVDDEMTEIEIEAVEIELEDCIEVCTD